LSNKVTEQQPTVEPTPLEQTLYRGRFNLPLFFTHLNPLTPKKDPFWVLRVFVSLPAQFPVSSQIIGVHYYNF